MTGSVRTAQYKNLPAISLHLNCCWFLTLARLGFVQEKENEMLREENEHFTIEVWPLTLLYTLLSSLPSCLCFICCFTLIFDSDKKVTFRIEQIELYKNDRKALTWCSFSKCPHSELYSSVQRNISKRYKPENLFFTEK